MFKSLRIYCLYFAQFLKTRMSYKWDFLSGMLASILASLGGVVFIMLLINGKSVPDLGGWKRTEVLFIYGYSLVATSLFGIFSPNLYRFGEKYIIEGQFDRVLLRPLNSLMQVLCESFNLESIGNLLLGLGLLLWNSSFVGYEYGVLDLAWLLLSSVSGAIILLSIFAIISSLSFHFEDRFGLVPPMYNLVLFSRYPLPIFNRLVQFILSWIIPFGFVAFYPATHFFSRPGYELFCYTTPLIAALCLILTSLAWKLGVSAYTSTGT